uniref:Protein sleepless n=1 Tax=Anopheles culicifacies TaxID=139723 RepID=A0A182M1C7_9DIPT
MHIPDEHPSEALRVGEIRDGVSPLDLGAINYRIQPYVYTDGKKWANYRCYGCASRVSFDDCTSKAIQVDCATLKPEFPWMPESINGTYACGKGSGGDRNGKLFIKTCVPKMPEPEFCALLTSALGSESVETCKVCTENLCNAGTKQVLTGALLLLAVGLMFRV